MCMYSCNCTLSFFLCKYLEMELLNYMKGVCLNLLETSNMFSKEVVLFYIPTSNDVPIAPPIPGNTRYCLSF